MLRNAKRFYIRNGDGKARRFRDVAAIMEREYNCLSRQHHIAAYLRNLRIQKFCSRSSSLSDALDRLHEEICKLAPQGLMYCRSERNRIEYLQNAVIGHSWARDACSRANAALISYRELYGQLEAAIQLEQEEKIGRVRDQKSLQLDSLSTDDFQNPEPNETLFTGQSRYKNRLRASRTSKFHHESRKRNFTSCNCGKRGHVIAECRQRKDLTNTAANRVQYLRRNGYKDQNKVLKRVLYEICQQLEESSDSGEFESAENFFNFEVNDDLKEEIPDLHPSEQYLAPALDPRTRNPPYPTALKIFHWVS